MADGDGNVSLFDSVHEERRDGSHALLVRGGGIVGHCGGCGDSGGIGGHVEVFVNVRYCWVDSGSRSPRSRYGGVTEFEVWWWNSDFATDGGPAFDRQNERKLVAG